MVFTDENVKDIHELEPINEVNGHEVIIVDNNTITQKMPLDALLGYFVKRIQGDTSQTIDVNELASASCIHIMPYGQTTPIDQRVKGHYYLQLTQKDSVLLEQALFQDSKGRFFTFKCGKEDVEDLYKPTFNLEITDDDVDLVRLLTINIKDTFGKTDIAEHFDLTVSSDTTIVSEIINLTALFSDGDYKSVSFADTVSDVRVIATQDGEKLSVWLDVRNLPHAKISILPILSVGWNSSLDEEATYMLSRVLDNYVARYAFASFNESKDYCYSDTFIANVRAETKPINTEIAIEMNRLEKMIVKTETSPGYNRASVNPSPVTGDNFIIPFVAVSSAEEDPRYFKVNPDGSISVARDGYYTLAFKQNLRVITGTGKYTMDITVNDVRIEDFHFAATITGEWELPFVTGVVTMRLHVNDMIKVIGSAQRDGTPPGVELDYVNLSTLQISKIMDVIEPVTFGNVGQELTAISGLAGASMSQLYTGIDIEGVDATTYDYPVVEVAKVDDAKLTEPENM